MKTTTAIYECLYVYMLAAVISLAIAAAIKCIVHILTTRGSSTEKP